MFGDDPFGKGIEELFNQFTRRNYSYNTRDNSRNLLSTVELPKETILIFDISGKKVISVKIEENSEIDEYGERIYDKQKVLTIKLENNQKLKYGLPRALSKRRVEYTLTNGILEVHLKK